MAATKRRKSNADGTPTVKVIGMLMAAIALFGWAFAAAAYAHAEEGWRRAEGTNVADTTVIGQDKRFEEVGNLRDMKYASWRDFVWNAVRQIPNAFAVISFNFQHRLWLIILFACLEAGALGLGYAMSKID